MADDLKLRENLTTIRKVAGSMKDDKDLSEAAKAKADRIDALAEQCLSALDSGQKPGESQ